MRAVRVPLASLSASALALALPATGSVALAHTGNPPTPDTLWTSWSWEPTVLLGLGVAAWAYARGVRALWRRAGRGRGVHTWQVMAFSGGLVSLFVALVSPLDALSSALFSAHMVQHLLLVVVAAPLLALGAPLSPFLWALPGPSRRTIGAWWRHARAGRAVWRGLSQPLVVWTVHAVTLWVWHLPQLFELTLRSEPVHVLEHASFLATALLFWWTLTPVGSHGRLGYGFGVLYSTAMGVQGSVLGALITFAGRPWYPSYVPTAAGWGLSPLSDQQLAGLIMWIPAGLIYLGAGAALFLAWLRAEEHVLQPQL